MSSNQQTRADIQAKQDAANKDAADAQAKTLAQAEQSRLNQYYVTNPNNLPPSNPNNIALDTPAGRVLYEEYKKSGVVFDPKTNNIIYNPADLGTYQIEQVRAAQGLTPNFKDSGVPSTQYQSSLFAAGVSAQQIQDIMKERANLVSITNTNKEELQKLAVERQQNVEKQKSIDSEIDQLNSTIPPTKIIGYKRGFALYNYAEQDGVRRSISRKVDSLLEQKRDLEKRQGEISSRQEILGSNLVNIGVAQKNLFNAQNRANYDRLFKPEPVKEKTAGGASAGVKSIVPPLQYTRLQGTNITAREFKAAKGSPDKMRALQLREQTQIPKTTERIMEPPQSNFIGGKLVPQRQRIKILENQTNKLFAAPAFAQKGSAEYLGIKQKTDSFQSNNISIDQAPLDTSASFTLEPGRFTAEEKQQNRQALQENQKKLSAQIKSFKDQGYTSIRIKDESGNEIKNTPINRAFYDISKINDKTVYLEPRGREETRLTKISQNALGVVTEEYTKGQVIPNTTGYFLPEQKIKVTNGVKESTAISKKELYDINNPPEIKPTDPLSKTIGYLGLQSRSSNPVIKASSRFFEEGLSTFGGLVNLNNLAAREIIKAKTGNTPLITDVKTAINTAPSKVSGGVITGLQKGYEYKSFKAFAGPAGEGIDNYFKELGKDPIGTISSTAGFLFPIGPEVAPIKSSQIVGKVALKEGLKDTKYVVRYVANEVPYSREFKTLAKAQKFEQEAVKSNVAKDITVEAFQQKASITEIGYGKYSRPIFSKVNGQYQRGFDPSKLGKQGFKEIAESYSTKAMRGTEIDALGDDVSRLLTSESSLNKLQAANILGSEDVELIRAGKTVVQESASLPNKLFRKDLTAQPFENLQPGLETDTVKNFFRKQNIRLEGSAIDIPTFLSKYVGYAGDFDVKVKNYAKAKQLAGQLVEDLNRRRNGDRRFIQEGGQVYVEDNVSLFGEGEKISSSPIRRKIGEFLSDDDPLSSGGQLSKTDKVFGVKTDTKTMKVENIKMRTGKFQINRRIASITSLLPTDEGVKVGAPDYGKVGGGRTKDYARAFAGAKTKAFTAKQKGKTEKAAKLEVAAQTIQKIGGQYLDFDEFFRSRRMKNTFVQQEPATTTQGIKTSIGRISGYGSNSSTINSLFGTSKISTGKQRSKESEQPSPRSKNIEEDFRGYGRSRTVSRDVSDVTPSRTISNIIGNKIKPKSITKSVASKTLPSNLQSRIISGSLPSFPKSRSPSNPYSSPSYTPRSPPSSPPSFTPSPSPSSPSPTSPPSPSPPYKQPQYPIPGLPGKDIPRIRGGFPFGGGRLGANRAFRLGKPRYSIYNISAYIPRAQIDAGPFVKSSSSPKIFKEIDIREIKALKGRSKQGGFNKTLFGLDTRKNRKTKY